MAAGAAGGSRGGRKFGTASRLWCAVAAQGWWTGRMRSGCLALVVCAGLVTAACAGQARPTAGPATPGPASTRAGAAQSWANLVVLPGEGGGVFATPRRLTLPQGLAFARLGGRWVLYVGESNQIDRYPWGAGGISGARTVLAARLPDL